MIVAYIKAFHQRDWKKYEKPQFVNLSTK